MPTWSRIHAQERLVDSRRRAAALRRASAQLAPFLPNASVTDGRASAALAGPSSTSRIVVAVGVVSRLDARARGRCRRRHARKRSLDGSASSGDTGRSMPCGPQELADEAADRRAGRRASPARASSWAMCSSEPAGRAHETAGRARAGNGSAACSPGRRRAVAGQHRVNGPADDRRLQLGARVQRRPRRRCGRRTRRSPCIARSDGPQDQRRARSSKGRLTSPCIPLAAGQRNGSTATSGPSSAMSGCGRTMMLAARAAPRTAARKARSHSCDERQLAGGHER